jgi:hypothetical protein
MITGRIICIVFFLFSIFFISTPISGAADISCKILQYKLDRLYFPIGREENIYPANSYTVYWKGDSIFHGNIEESRIGVSYSYVTHYFFDSIDVESCEVIIESAGIDSTAEIVIGLPNSIPPGNIFRLSDIYSSGRIPFVLPPLFAVNGNPLKLQRYDSEIEMLLDFEAGWIDGFFSHSKIITEKKNAQSISHPLTCFAAIVPGINRPVNEDGLLSASLYYRFDNKRLSALFDGDDIKPHNCFYPRNDLCDREATYNPSKARSLLRQIAKPPKEVKLIIGDVRLKKLGQYYADVLNRDRIKTTLSYDKTDGDIYLKFVPTLTSLADTSLMYIHSFLAGDTTENGLMNAMISIIDDCLELSRQTTSSEAREYYIGRVLEYLEKDIGVYPLFRPSIYFTVDAHLKGFGFDPDGFFNLLALTRIQLSENSTGKY